jgi:hypothetical protein
MFKKLNRKFLFLGLLYLAMIPLSGLAQDQKARKKEKANEFSAGYAKGTVADIYGEALFGVTITNKTSGLTTTSDRLGKYTIEAAIGETLAFNLNGYLVKEIAATQESGSVTLTEVDKHSSLFGNLFQRISQISYSLLFKRTYRKIGWFNHLTS